MCVSNLVGMFIQKIVMLADGWVSKSRVLSNNPNTLLSLLLLQKPLNLGGVFGSFVVEKTCFPG